MMPFDIKNQPFTETVEMKDDAQPYLIITRTYKFKTKLTAHRAIRDLDELGLDAYWASADCKSVGYQIAINLDGMGIADMYSYSKPRFCKWN